MEPSEAEFPCHTMRELVDGILGRSEEISKIRVAFVLEPHSSPIPNQQTVSLPTPQCVIVYGVGGVEKSVLAMTVVHELKDGKHSDTIFWLKVGDPDELRASFTKVAL